MHLRVLRIVLTVVAAMLVTAGSAADRVALVVGIGNYAHATPLPNPSHDAEAIAASLRGLGFEVIEGLDLDKAGFDDKVRDFAEKSYDAEVALFFYAGHGVQANGRNYLIPADAKLETFTALDFETIELDSVLKYTAGEGRVSLAFIDACRDNPFTRSIGRGFDRSAGDAGQGLAMPQLSSGGMLIAFATSPGSTAGDGTGYHSPFTQALLGTMATPGLEVQQMMTRVKADVFETTGGRQEPWHNSSLRTEYFFAPAADGIVSTVVQPSTPPDEALWQRIAATEDVAKLRLFVETFPASPHASESRARIAAYDEKVRTSTSYDGPLEADSAEYVVIADGAIGRDVPDLGAPRKVLLAEGAVVKASGRLSVYLPEEEGDWLRVAAADGTAAFVRRSDLMWADMRADRDTYATNQSDLSVLFDRVEAASGPLKAMNGTWTTGTCMKPIATNLTMNLQVALLSRQLYWSERDGEVLRASAVAPGQVTAIKVSRHRKISLSAAGTVQFYKFQYEGGTVDVSGIKGDTIYYAKDASEKNFGMLTRCGAAGDERYTINDWYDMLIRNMEQIDPS